MLTDANGLLMSWTASPGQRHESQELKRLLANSLFPVDWIGHRPQAIAGDKGYGSAEIREHIARKRIQVVIPRKSNEAPAEDFNPKTYRRRNIVERAIGWLKVSRRVFVRYDKLTSSYLAFVQLAAM
ncbi:IS5 family transposase [Bremerella cremea]